MSDVVLPQPVTVETVERARAGYAGWRARRLASVVEPTGNLSLIETRWFAPGDTTTPEKARTGSPDSVTATELTRQNLETGEIERGIRLWDANSPAIQAFETVTAFPFNPDWVLGGTFEPVSDNRTVPFEHLRDHGLTREKVVPGDITLILDGARYVLSAFDDNGRLLLTFGDPTNRATGESATYGAGRFLFVALEGTQVVLDFNRAFVPPCGFSDHFNCPLPPPNNQLRTPITAGEKKVIFRDVSGY